MPTNPVTIVVMILFVAAISLYLWVSGRKEASETVQANELGEKYKEMSRELLDAVPDSELVPAVIANLLTALEESCCDAYSYIPGLSRGRCAVYSVWLVSNELKTKTIAEYLTGYTADFAPLAADGFELIGAQGCADALRSAINASTLDMDDIEQAVAESQDNYITAVESELPLELCHEYIRTNPDDFVDYSLLDGDEPKLENETGDENVLI